MAQAPLGLLERPLVILAVESHRGQSHLGEGVSPRSGEQLVRLVEPALSAPQLAEADNRFDGKRRQLSTQLLAGRMEVLLSLLPSALVHEDRPVVGPADSEERTVPPSNGKLLQPSAPLGRPGIVSYALAPVDQVAAGGADGIRIGHQTT